ncbi:MAG: type II secretion system F family protein [Candidatus Paceibacterota bacterium]|jgi:type IV pilus assembly protein PilC
MLFTYKASDQQGSEQTGNIEAGSMDSAIATLQQRNLLVIDIKPANQAGFLAKLIPSFDRVALKDIVILSRQLSTLFEAKVPVGNIFKLLAAESESRPLRAKLSEMTDDIQGGMSISAAMSRHPDVFTAFYVSMIRAGEESGKLSETFEYLADYLERNYAIVSKTRNALLYPAFVILSFIIVMLLMFIVVVPQLASILKDSGQELPFYTQMVIWMSDLLVNDGLILLVIVIISGLGLWYYTRSPAGKTAYGYFKMNIPYLGDLYRKLYVSRIADNMDTMLSSGISMVRAMEITADVVGDDVYKKVLLDTMEDVKGGSPLSEAFSRHPEIPSIIIQMSRIGEETGKLGFVLKTMARFYKREVDTAIDTLVGLIEPIMIIALGLGVGFLLISVLGPIYNITSSIS